MRSVEDLNRKFWQWVETDYNQQEHSALAGESPAQRFARLGTGLRLLEPGSELERLFLMRLPRRVRKDATFRLGGEAWEVPAHLRGRWSPSTMIRSRCAASKSGSGRSSSAPPPLQQAPQRPTSLQQ